MKKYKPDLKIIKKWEKKYGEFSLEKVRKKLGESPDEFYKPVIKKK